MITGLVCSGCSSEEEVSPEIKPVTSDVATEEAENQPQVPDSTTAQDPVVTDGKESEQPAVEDALTERDQFMEDQQLPLDGSPLSAVTPEQKQFIEEQRTHVEDQGGVWTPEAESVTLALTADACETAILNNHDTDASTVQMHIDTSPLFGSQLPESLPEAQRAQAEMSMADIMVYGMQHMCPNDFQQWSEAVMELHPEYYG
ncbi:MAG: hypothetical protein L0K41_11220 [Yaniella sp.]|nr:hypothetical protein [Yaniella sp.]MDN5732376.1 hypothetical protein [Yaniella sp.]MDN5890269.1 hypothetical protein [Yaniella sp.]MDN5913285.1 hypothetical protein [Yaniella sp.]MDN6457011.1 hypothetical protein [Yaniella sp.]MDN6490951.1 hypothetical protein [Yaniella sp.]